VRQLREPEAVSIVQNGRLRIGVRRFSRFHDRIQILDNAKHVLFSTKTFEIPTEGPLTFSIEIAATGSDCVPGDLYDGFASFLCLDLTTGTAIDVFCRDDMCAAVFARLPFPGVTVEDLEPFKYWGLFDEHTFAATGRHRYSITIDQGLGSIMWSADDEVIRRQRLPDYRLGPLMLGLGLMTEKDIGPEGSVSCHGQGLTAEWGPIEITRSKTPSAQ
jgi:hypothetical protein